LCAYKTTGYCSGNTWRYRQHSDTVMKDSLNIDGHQLHQYQQKEHSPVTELTEHKKEHDIQLWKSRFWLVIVVFCSRSAVSIESRINHGDEANAITTMYDFMNELPHLMVVWHVKYHKILRYLSGNKKP